MITRDFCNTLIDNKLPYKGVIKVRKLKMWVRNFLYQCRVMPPTALRIPVLGVSTANGLIFALCGTCAHTLNRTERCTHGPVERALEGTWTTPELNLALSQGYKIVE